MHSMALAGRPSNDHMDRAAGMLRYRLCLRPRRAGKTNPAREIHFPEPIRGIRPWSAFSFEAAASERSDMDIGKLEYKVRPVTRYVVTRYQESASGQIGGSSQCGEYDNPDVAHEVACALCKQEHERLGLPLDDERVRYPQRRVNTAAVAPIGGIIARSENLLRE